MNAKKSAGDSKQELQWHHVVRFTAQPVIGQSYTVQEIFPGDGSRQVKVTRLWQEMRWSDNERRMVPEWFMTIADEDGNQQHVTYEVAQVDERI